MQTVHYPEATGVQWYDWQKAVIRYFFHGGTHAVIVVPRREGKDLVSGVCIGNSAMKLAERGQAATHWWAFPKYSQAKEAVWEGMMQDGPLKGRPMLDVLFPEPLVTDRHKTELALTLVGGSRVRLIGTDNINNVVGAGIGGVVFSEFALATPWAHNFVSPMIERSGGWTLYQSTPRGRNQHFEMLQRAQKEGWFWLHMDVYMLHPDGAHGEECWLCRGKGRRGVAEFLERQVREGMPEAIVRQEYLCDFEAANVGSIYGDLLEQLVKRGGVQSFEPVLQDTFATLDLGIDDHTAIWLWRLRQVGENTGIEFIDFFADRGKPLKHYLDYLAGLPQHMLGGGLAQIFVPHDSRAKNLNTGTSILEEMLKDDRFQSGKQIHVVPNHRVDDGIQAGRKLLTSPLTRFHRACDEKGHLGYSGLEALKAYHRKWDESRRILLPRPEHDWSSHAADSFRYVAVMFEEARRFLPDRPAPRMRPEPGTIDIPELGPTRTVGTRRL